jgi:Meiotically Up-regulated Gene 113 (MUG113) protein
MDLLDMPDWCMECVNYNNTSIPSDHYPVTVEVRLNERAKAFYECDQCGHSWFCLWNKMGINDPERGGVVYIMQSPALGLYKIGRTKNLDQRFKSLRTGNPDIKLIGCFDGGNKLEKELHDMLSEQRVAGEWFRLSATQVDLLLRSHNFEEKEHTHEFTSNATRTFDERS